jgi:2-polyprenyl-6-methoxyphenol hydroxylase-like FAD-dependent oxidoreductase
MHHQPTLDVGPEVPVVIVGAGPAGLVAAITLARHGVHSLVVERRPEPSTLPKATVISLRNMELLRSWGLADEVLAGGDDVEWRMLFTRTLAEAGSGHTIEVGVPSKEQSQMLSPVAPACVPQDHLEAVLRDHVDARPGVELRTGVDVIEVRQVVEGCEVVLQDQVTRGRRTVKARYVIGADGAHGVVRQQAGIGIRNYEDSVRSLSVVYHAPMWDVVGEHRYGIYIVQHPTAPSTVLPAGGDRWIHALRWDPTTEALADYPAERLIERIRTAAGAPDLPVRLGRVGSFSFSGAMADRFREGSVFLVGDAAHRVTPRGGTGMNTAMLDGFDLGWKLAWVTHGWAPESLLDTYETERRPVAQHNLERSLDAEGSLRTVLDEVNVDLGGRLRHLWLPADGTGERHSTLDLVGPGLTRFTGPCCPTWPAPPYAAPVTTRVLDPMVARGLGVTPRGSLLVRPDGVPVGLRAGRRADSVDDTTSAEAELATVA